jgi:hypothetical protein
VVSPECPITTRVRSTPSSFERSSAARGPAGCGGMGVCVE